MAIKYKVLLIFFLCSGCFSAYSQNKDSLWAVWKNKSVVDTTRLDAIDYLCLLNTEESLYDSALKLADMGYLFARTVKSVNREKYVIRSLLRKADIYHDSEDTRLRSFNLYQLCLKLSRREKYDNGMGVSLNNIGNIYLSWGDYSSAIHYFYEGLKAIERRKDTTQLVAAWSNIATIYTHSERSDSALAIFRRIMPLSEKRSNIRQHSSLLRSLANVYFEIDENDSAIYYMLEALKIKEKLGAERQFIDAYLFLSQAYKRKNDLVKAQECISQCRALAEKYNDSLYIAKSMGVQSVIFHKQGKLGPAIALCRQCLGYLKNQRNPSDLIEMTDVLSEWYKEKGDLKEALAMREWHSNLQDTVRNTDSRHALYLEELKYSSEKKEMLIKSETEKKMSLLQAEADRRDFHKTIWLIVTMFLVLILLIASWFLYNHYRQKNVIETQRNNLMKQQLLVAQMNPHFIFNSLNAIQNFIFKQDSLNAGIYLKQFSELIRMILDFSRKDLITLGEERVFLERYLELQKLRFDRKLNYELIIDHGLEEDLVLVPPMLAQPFIENAIEHGIFYKDGEGFLSIRISLKGEAVLYEIEDNGIGLNGSKKIKSEMVTKHKSLAIQITRERIEAMNTQNKTDFEIEIKDKNEKDTSGVYVKFATPFLTL